MAFRTIGSHNKGVSVCECDRNRIYALWGQPKPSHNSDRVAISLQLSDIVGSVIYDGAKPISELHGSRVSGSATHTSRWQRLYQRKGGRSRIIQFEH
jgi:hypothetical protein